MSYQIGQRIGNYRLVRLIGQGNFGSVYLAEHVLLQTQAAIKLLHHQIDAREQEAFRSEARIIASLKHPHLIRVLDFGFEGGNPYLITEYASNGTLGEKHPRGSSVPVETVMTYLQQIADGLQYAHDRQIIHRDLKPANLLLDEDMRIVISDFGIAIRGSRRFTDLDGIAGTVAYMAPEQINGKPGRASDQYSLGIMVYEWLAGAVPFNGFSFIEIAYQQQVALPPPLRDRNPGISPIVEQVVFRSLAKDPSQRYESVRAFANAFVRAATATSGSVTPVASLAMPTILPDGPSASAQVMMNMPLPVNRIPDAFPSDSALSALPLQPAPLQPPIIPAVSEKQITTPKQHLQLLDKNMKVQVEQARKILWGHTLRWVPVSKLTGSDAMWVEQQVEGGKTVLVRDHEDFHDLFNVLPPGPSPLTAAHERAEQQRTVEARNAGNTVPAVRRGWQRHEDRYAAFVFFCGVSWIVAWIGWSILMCLNATSIGNILMLRFNADIPMWSWILLFSCVGVCVAWSWVLCQITGDFDVLEGVPELMWTGIGAMTWMLSSCLLVGYIGMPFNPGYLLFGAVFPGLLLGIVTVPVGFGTIYVGGRIGSKLSKR